MTIELKALLDRLRNGKSELRSLEQQRAAKMLEPTS
jgi:hypothetical protein